MGNIKKTQSKKRGSQGGMKDKYWKQVFLLAEAKSWEELCLLVEKNRWLATTAISQSMLPDYLAEDKEYNLLRLLANVGDIPVEVIRKIISLGANDKKGRCYLVRLLAGGEPAIAKAGEENGSGKREELPEDSPFIAAELLRTADRPIEVVHQMQRTLEQGISDNDPGRQALAERCLHRSQFFYDLVLILQDEGAEERLIDCLACEELLIQFQSQENRDWGNLQSLLKVCGD